MDQLAIPMNAGAMYSYVQSISKVKRGKMIRLEVLAKSVLGDKIEHMMTLFNF